MIDSKNILWTAIHSDGFTEHLLRYTLTAIGHEATIDAKWHIQGLNKVANISTFLFDVHRIIRLLPAIRTMQPKYEATMTDMDRQILTVELDGERIERNVYGRGLVCIDHPEIRPFCEFFDWVHFVVMSRLDWPTQKRPRHLKLDS